MQETKKNDIDKQTKEGSHMHAFDVEKKQTIYKYMTLQQNNASPQEVQIPFFFLLILTFFAQIGPVGNSEDFQTAYGCPADSAMNR